jgi:hypothetical protein
LTKSACEAAGCVAQEPQQRCRITLDHPRQGSSSPAHGSQLACLPDAARSCAK